MTFAITFKFLTELKSVVFKIKGHKGSNNLQQITIVLIVVKITTKKNHNFIKSILITLLYVYVLK